VFRDAINVSLRDSHPFIFVFENLADGTTFYIEHLSELFLLQFRVGYVLKTHFFAVAIAESHFSSFDTVSFWQERRRFTERWEDVGIGCGTCRRNGG
jgi:hypothetical protein